MRRSAIGTLVSACALLFGAAPAGAHHDKICTGDPPICVYGHQHQIDNTLANPPGVLREIVLATPSALAGYLPDRICRSIAPGSTDEGICLTGLRGFALYWAGQTRSALEPATCALWTAAGWRCD